MKKLKPIIIGVLSTSLFISSSIISAAPTDDAIVSINGKAITQQDYDDYLKIRGGDNNAQREIIINELIQRRLLLQQADKLGIEKLPEFQQKINILRDNLLMSVVIENYLTENPVDKAEVKQEYDNIPYEYQARHILVKTQEQAQTLIEQLKQGNSFTWLARKYSSDTNSAKNGGKLGWITRFKVVAEFGAALETLEKGHHTTEPVQTKFGWHIIKLDNKRKPPFEKIKAKIRTMLQNQKIQNYLKQITAQAKIQKFETPTDGVIAIVNDKRLTQQNYDDYLQVRIEQGHGKSNSNREMVLEELIQRELLLQKAHKLGINQTTRFKQKLNPLRDNLLMSAVVENHLAENPIDDAELKQEYQRQIEQIDPHEYKVRHILVNSQKEAQTLIEALKQDKSFTELAKTHSLDKGSAKQGGKLDWIGLSDVVVEFGTALKTLEKGHYTTEPVETSYGWHIIKMDGKRKISPPSFEELKPKIHSTLKSQKIQNYLIEITTQAKIEW